MRELIIDSSCFLFPSLPTSHLNWKGVIIIILTNRTAHSIREWECGAECIYIHIYGDECIVYTLALPKAMVRTQ